jgi:hypothetical protein
MLEPARGVLLGRTASGTTEPIAKMSPMRGLQRLSLPATALIEAVRGVS